MRVSPIWGDCGFSPMYKKPLSTELLDWMGAGSFSYMAWVTGRGWKSSILRMRLGGSRYAPRVTRLARSMRSVKGMVAGFVWPWRSWKDSELMGVFDQFFW